MILFVGRLIKPLPQSILFALLAPMYSLEQMPQNIFGSPLGVCFIGAPGYHDTCPWGDSDLHKSLICVEPVGVESNPFCLDMAKFGRYLLLNPIKDHGRPKTGDLAAKCESMPKEFLFSTFANAHIQKKEFVAIALHLCQSCLWDGAFLPGPAEVCLTLARGTTTSTGTTTTVTQTTTYSSVGGSGGNGAPAYGLPAGAAQVDLKVPIPIGHLKLPGWPTLPSGPKAFWPFAIFVSLGWTIAIFSVSFLRSADDSESSESDDAYSRIPRFSFERKARPPTSFSGHWQMLGQTQMITGQDIRWQDRKVCPITVTGPSSFSVKLNGREKNAVLDDDGQRLLWSDGSVWFRAEESLPLLE